MLEIIVNAMRLGAAAFVAQNVLKFLEYANGLSFLFFKELAAYAGFEVRYFTVHSCAAHLLLGRNRVILLL